MLALENIIYDIRHILKACGNDSEVNDFHLMDKIHNYRSRFIQEKYRREFYVDPAWLQVFKSEPVTVVNSGDTPGYTGKNDILFGKVEFPSIIPFSSPIAIQLFSESNWKQFYEITQGRLKLLIESKDTSLQSFNYYFRIGNACYIHNWSFPVNATLILENPLEGFIYRTTNVLSGQIIMGESYDVVSGSIIYNGDILNTGTTFNPLAGQTTFLGRGVVNFTNIKKKMTVRDPYPVDRAMAQAILMEITTKDFQISAQKAQDVINDSADTTNLVKENR